MLHTRAVEFLVLLVFLGRRGANASSSMGSESEFSSLLLNSSSSSEKSAAARSVGEIGLPRGRRRWEAVSRRRDNRRGASWASVPCGDSTMIVLDMHDQ